MISSRLMVAYGIANALELASSPAMTTPPW
jgi:hypothetical protein